jgi:Skp family chaperone for outer membrane proteins
MEAPSLARSARVKKSLLIAACVAGFLASAARAQQQPAHTDVVLVDLSLIFQKYAGFTEMRADLQTAVDVAEKEIGRLRDEAKKKLSELKVAQKGTPQHQQLQDDITRLQVEINTRVSNGRKDFAGQEAKIFFSVYKQVQDEVATFCRRQGVRVALQYNSKPLTEDDGAELLQRIQQPVLFAEPTVDITNYVLEQLNARYAQRQGGQTPATGAPRR